MSDNFDNIFNDLTPVSKNNRYAKQECDLLFDPEKGSNGKFVVSKSLFHRLDLNDHGFIAMTGRGRAFVGVVPNEDAVTYAGKASSDNKTDEFTSTELRDRLNDVGMEENKFWLSFAGTKDNTDYYEIVDEDPETNTDDSDEGLTASEPVNDTAEKASLEERI